MKSPGPEEAGLGMAIWPLYSGLVRAAQLTGVGRVRSLASMMFTQSAKVQAHSGGWVLGITHRALDMFEPLGRLGQQQFFAFQEH
jgi:hypothetical protein